MSIDVYVSSPKMEADSSSALNIDADANYKRDCELLQLTVFLFFDNSV